MASVFIYWIILPIQSNHFKDQYKRSEGFIVQIDKSHLVKEWWMPSKEMEKNDQKCQSMREKDKAEENPMSLKNRN